MPFAICNVHESISGCNSRLFGFLSFSHAFFETLHLGFECYNDARFKKTGVDKAGMSFRETIYAIVGFRWREQGVDILRQKTFWENVSRVAKDNVVLHHQLVEREAAFQREGRFGTYTHESLYFAYQQLKHIGTLLNRAVRDIQAAKRRRFWGRIPNELLQRYDEYIQEQRRVLKKEREDILNAMLIRLKQAAKDPFLENADAFSTTLKDLKAKNIIRKEYRVMEHADNKLTPALFRKFHRCINTHAVSKKLSPLAALPWFDDKPSLAKRFNVHIWMPASPKSPGFLYFLANLRYHWFEDFHDYAKVDASLSYLRASRVTAQMTHESLSQRIMCIHSAQMALQTQLLRIQEARAASQRGLRKYFADTTLHFLTVIEDTLKKQSNLLIEEKLYLLNSISIAPIAQIKSIHIYGFIRALSKEITPDLREKFDKPMEILKKRVNDYFEHALKPYLIKWASIARLKTLSHDELSFAYAEAEQQELLLIALLPPKWADRVSEMRAFRLSNQFNLLETTAGLNLTQLLLECPSMLHKQVKWELAYLSESLIEYIKNYVSQFDYPDQKKAIFNMIARLYAEGVTEARASLKLSDADKKYLATFPEVNFFVNVMLTLKSEEQALLKCHNPAEIDDRLTQLHHDIQRQESIFLKRNPAKFVSLFCKSSAVTENHASLNLLKRAIL